MTSTPEVRRGRGRSYVWSVFGTAIVTALCTPLREHLNVTTVALAYLVAVLFVAARLGSGPAMLGALLATLAYNFFFLPPIYTLTIADPRNWVALSAFLATAIVAGQLSERARRRAAGAEAERSYARRLLEASLDPLVTISPDGRITDVNEAAVLVTGVLRGDLVGTEFPSYFTDPDKAREGYRKAFTSGSVRDYPLTLKNRRDGTLTDVLYNASVYTDDEGSVRGVFAAARDVTAWRKAEDELRRLNRAHRALSMCNLSLIRATDETEWLFEVCRIAVEQAGYVFCWVGRAEQDATKTVRPVARAGAEDGYLEKARITWADEERGRGPTGTCVRERRPVVARDLAADPRMAPWRADALRRGFASSIAIPLSLDPTTGTMTIYAAERDAFGTAEVALLSELADDLSYGIKVLHTRAERNKAQEELRALNAELEARVTRRTAELRAARQREAETGGKIQRMLLLDEPPRDLRGLGVAAVTIPSQQIAGDFYGFFRHEREECLDVLVADVMGKGVPAALLGAATKEHFPEALWHLLSNAPLGFLPEPREIVTLAHARMARQLILLESFVTACYARFDVGRRRLTLVDCGHTGVIVMNAASGRTDLLHGENLPLGVRDGQLFDEFEVTLDPDDVVVFFSDGVTEARNADGELFGTDRLLACLRARASAEPDAIVAAVRDAAAAFAGRAIPTDDLTCVVVKSVPHEAPVARAEVSIASAVGELRRARTFVHEFCAGLEPPLGEEATASLTLAVDEAASNVMKHVHAGKPDQRIEMAAEAYVDRVSMRLRYVGIGFDPSAAPPPAFDGSRDSGFGVFLIARTVDDVRYERDDLGRSCIRLEKRRAHGKP